jgi:hypothetical protein
MTQKNYLLFNGKITLFEVTIFLPIGESAID